MLNKNLIVTTVLASAAVLPVMAVNMSDTLKLTEIEVIAPRKTSVELTPLTVSTVGSETIENSGQSSLLPVLQNQIPGLFVSERGFAGYGVSGGSAGSVSIRGVG